MNSTLKYLVIGVGGTGGCIGGYLARQAKNVTLIARGEHKKKMEERGLHIKTNEYGQIIINPVNVKTSEEYNSTPDVIFICVKYYSLPQIIPFINRIAKEDTIVIPILNVISSGEELRKKCPNCVVLDGTIYVHGFIESPGVIVKPTSIFKICYGFRKNQYHVFEGKITQLTKDLEESGIQAIYTDTILKEEFKKFSFTGCIGITGVFLNKVAKDFKYEDYPKQILYQLVDEVGLLCHSLGITFEESLQEHVQSILNQVLDDSTTSMQRDVNEGKISEMSGLLFNILDLAQTSKVYLPTFTTIAAWVKSRDIK
ncbi:hypothetical protein EIN_021330 [Entamoeba invadens IP1]|uniref:hypothetical protein n=1 Tax=Entamoeba invadens IP1 TaxID=370355 RepID=UPI0002C3E4D1|nr:hypothetical protein EIN_021330 [Entamoeba invadens IP1]ELP90614.1 hypothetical protein EIN_021330 [Entamoeba invadens IP1]|eukprot:XP_004257385.1 hypothetical protein EIN_021330 [Entamoeba invadens IP1]